MKERPILFSAPMVRALLEDRKTKTRRIVKPQPAGAPQFDAITGLWHEPVSLPSAEGPVDALRPMRCPYGVPGDVLWVREAHAFPNDQVTIYRANWRADARAQGLDNIPADDSAIRWRPSIHMPRRSSRITLRVTDVRVERLNDISEADALAEGLEVFEIERGPTAYRGFREGKWVGAPELAYRDLWEHINGAGSWAANPWVWAVSFEVQS